MLVRAALPVLLLVALVSGVAAAQGSAAAELALAKRQAAEALARSQQLDRRAAQATGQAAKARTAAAAVAARIEAAEADVTAAQTRIRIIEALRAQQRAHLAERQQPVAHLAAALQTMARRPAALALVQPGSLDDVVHVRSLLASTLPVIRQRTTGLRQEIAAGTRLRRQAETAVAVLVASRKELGKQRIALARLEIRERERSESLAGSALNESDRALAFTEEARDLTALIGTRDYQAKLGASLAELPGPVLRPGSGRPATRLTPAARRYILPVDGRLVTGMGEISDAGVHARGLTFETAPGTPVVAPRAGRIVYAGPFRSYGSVVIIDHGGGWTSLMANIGTTVVEVGDIVSLASPIGRTRPGRSRVIVELRRNGRPFPITPLIATS